MDSHASLDPDELESSWSEHTSPSSDDIEAIAKQIVPARRSLGSTIMSGPQHIRRRLQTSPTLGEREGLTSMDTMDAIVTSPGNPPQSTVSLPSPPTTTFTLIKPPAIYARRLSAAGLLSQAHSLEPGLGWSQDEDEDMVMPKIEELDDDIELSSLEQVPAVEPTMSPTQEKAPDAVSPTKIKRRRGRPRKNPLQTAAEAAAAAQIKITKGRSKTGCLTCRKRKKKCDETKPRCRNCEKNAVVCEGYPERTIWKSGKERAEEAQAQMRFTLPTITLQPVIHGVETPGDRMFFEHYVFRLSTIFTFEGDRNNAFKDMLLPLAIQHLGLMHSILALSARHIDFNEPYGRALLDKHPDVDEPGALARSVYHHDEALRRFHLDIEAQTHGKVEKPVLSARYGQMLCLVLETVMEGDSLGTHRVHLEAYQRLIRESPPDEGPFLEFIKEFFQYHIAADELVSLPQGRGRLGGIAEEFTLPTCVIQPEAVRMLGVQDGLFFHMSKITKIRNNIRERMRSGLEPPVDYESLYLASEIDAGIREWQPPWPPGDSRDLAGLLYKQMMWVYLYRTLYPPKTTDWEPDQRIISAVDDGLNLLSRFPPNDRSQTLLLAPSFILGCAAFVPSQRPPIREAIRTVRSYTGLSNADRVLEVLSEVWRLMDEKSERSWDWQNIAKSMGMDFLAT